MRHLKPWYLSAGVWGAAVSVGASAAALLGTLQQTPDLAAPAAPAPTPAAGWPLPLAALLGGAAALYGRVRATRRIALAAPPRLAPSLAAQDWRMNAAAPLALALAPLLAAGAAGCGAAGGALSSPSAAYVAADRATFQAVAPEYAAYVDADPALAEDERARRGRTIETWRLRVEAGEGATGKSEAPNAKSETSIKDQTGKVSNRE